MDETTVRAEMTNRSLMSLVKVAEWRPNIQGRVAQENMMSKNLTTHNDEGKYRIQRPSTNKQEYHGNGANAWHGQTEEINGHVVEYKSKRYSYRWHKLQVWFDGLRLKTAKDYQRAEETLNK